MAANADMREEDVSSTRDDVEHRFLARRTAHGLVPELKEIETSKQMLARTEQSRRHRKVHFVDELRFEILPDGRHTAEKPNILVARSLSRTVECRVNAVGNEMECCPSFHFQRRARVMREHECRRVVWWILSPPSAP